MPETKLTLKPGIDRQKTQTLNTGGWSDSSLVRFRDSLPQKWGGWQAAISSTLDAICRGLFSWLTLAGSASLALGTTRRINLVQGATLYDITPLDASGTEANDPFTTVSGSALVSIAHNSHGRTAGDVVQFSGAGVFNGVTLTPGSGYTEYIVLTVTSANAYKITAPQTASGSGAGGGAAVLYRYYIPSGPESALFGAGWGAGVWGGTYLARTWGAAASSTIKSQSPRTVSFDNWGEDLIINPRGGAIYQWDASVGTGTRATVLTANDAPTLVFCILVGMPERHLLAYGCNNPLTALAFDPLLVRWSDVETYNTNGNWTATALNTAGSFRLTGGNRIMRAIRTQGGVLVLTDDVCILQTFIGATLVYSFKPQGAGSGLISVNAAIDVNGTTFWWGPTGFFVWNGALRKIESAVHNDIFGTGDNGFNREQAEKIYVGQDSLNNEINWFYPSNGGTGECDRMLTYNFVEGLWYASALPRTAYIDRAIFPYPLAVHTNGTIYYHEIGVDDGAAGMTAYIESGYVDLSGGDQLIYVDRLIPDFADFTGELQITFKGRQYPDGPITTKGPYTVTSATTFVRSPIRAREVAIRITSSAVGDWWRLGGIRIKSQPDGRIY